MPVRPSSAVVPLTAPGFCRFDGRLLTFSGALFGNPRIVLEVSEGGGFQRDPAAWDGGIFPSDGFGMDIPCADFGSDLDFACGKGGLVPDPILDTDGCPWRGVPTLGSFDDGLVSLEGRARPIKLFFIVFGSGFLLVPRASEYNDAMGGGFNLDDSDGFLNDKGDLFCCTFSFSGNDVM